MPEPSRLPWAVVLLDIDGTLLAGGPGSRRALGSALRGVFGSSGAIQGVRFGGKTDRLIVKEAHPETPPFEDPRWSELWTLYASCLEQELSIQPPTLLPGAKELVDTLLAMPGVAVGLVTGNIPQGAFLKLRHAGLGTLADRGFDIGAHAHDGPTKEALGTAARHRSVAAFGAAGAEIAHVVLGDTPADVACARAAGARAVAVATGSFDRATLLQEGADAVLDTLGPLATALEALLPDLPPTLR